MTPDNAEPTTVRVSGRTNVKDLAWSIHKRAEEGIRMCLRCIGNQALNQAVKAVAIANGHGAAQGRVLTMLPSMEDLMIDGGDGGSVERTALKLNLIPYRF